MSLFALIKHVINNGKSLASLGTALLAVSTTNADEAGRKHAENELQARPGVRITVALPTLINNNGATKPPTSKPVIDTSKAITVFVSCRGNTPIESASDIKNRRNLIVHNNTDVTTTLPAGEVAVLEFKFN